MTEWDIGSLTAKLAENPDLAEANAKTDARTSKSRGVKVKSNTKRRNKYGVSPPEERTYNNVVYASKKESRKAQELDLLKEAGEINFWLRQVPFSLPGGIIYRADFVTFVNIANIYIGDSLIDKHWIVKVIETKGFKTPEWKLKLKLFRETYPDIEMVIE